MKILGFVAAGLFGVAGIVPTAAIAAPGRTRTVVVHKKTVEHRSSGWHATRWGTRKVCENRWRNGHRIRVCRTVRYRR